MTQPTPPDSERDEDEAYKIGKDDGYSEAVQEIDLLTGGDGEYRYSMGGDPDRHTPDPETMKARIVERFEDLTTLRQRADKLEAGLSAAIRAADLAMFVIRKQGVMPNSSWESGLESDIALAKAALEQST